MLGKCTVGGLLKKYADSWAESISHSLLSLPSRGKICSSRFHNFLGENTIRRENPENISAGSALPSRKTSCRFRSSNRGSTSQRRPSPRFLGFRGAQGGSGSGTSTRTSAGTWRRGATSGEWPGDFPAASFCFCFCVFLLALVPFFLCSVFFWRGGEMFGPQKEETPSSKVASEPTFPFTWARIS